MRQSPERLTAAMPAAEVLRRLRGRVTDERTAGALMGERMSGYVGSFSGRSFRIRVARPLPQFYATYFIGQLEESAGGSVVSFHFGRRALATWALWTIRLVGALLLAAAAIAAFRDPVFVLGAVVVGVGVGSLLWAYRLRDDDKDRLRSFVVASLQGDDPR